MTLPHRAESARLTPGSTTPTKESKPSFRYRRFHADPDKRPWHAQLLAWALSQVVPSVAKGSAPGITQSVGGDRLKVALLGLASHCDECAQTFVSADTLGRYLIPNSTPKGQRNAGHLAIAGLKHLGLIEELENLGNSPHPRRLQLAWPDRMPDSSQEAPTAITTAITTAINEVSSSRTNRVKLISLEEPLSSLSSYVGVNRLESFSVASEVTESDLSIGERWLLEEQREEARRLQEQAKAEQERAKTEEARAERARRLGRWLAEVARHREHAKTEEELAGAKAFFSSDSIQAELAPLAKRDLTDKLGKAATLDEISAILAPIYDRFSSALLQELRK